MAKACAYLCRQCCFIDGFGEFGEFACCYRLYLLLLRSHKVIRLFFFFCFARDNMYNLRTRVKAVSAGCARPHAVMGAPVLPAIASQMTTSQSLELLGDDVETLPETEVYGEISCNVDDVIDETVGVTRPPTPAQMSILSPMPFRDTPPHLGTQDPSQQGYSTVRNPLISQ